VGVTDSERVQDPFAIEATSVASSFDKDEISGTIRNVCSSFIRSVGERGSESSTRRRGSVHINNVWDTADQQDPPHLKFKITQQICEDREVQVEEPGSIKDPDEERGLSQGLQR
jgi:hypothetical protein